MMHIRKGIFPVLPFFVLAFLLVLVKGFLYSTITPLWEGIDEPYHFAYVHALAANKSLPIWGKTFVNSDVAQSTALTPLPPLMPRLAPGEKLSYWDYWRLQPEQRKELNERLRALKAEAAVSQPSPALLYQAQHPPLYYLLCVPLYKLVNSWSLLEKVYALRLFSIFMASLSVVGAWLAFRRRGMVGASLVLLMVMLPGLYVDVARVGNDSLSAAVFSLLFAAMISYGARKTALSAFSAGVLLGLGLLTKATFLTAIPALAIYLFLIAARKGTRSGVILTHGVLLFFSAAVIAGWWYIRNYFLYGAFTGLQESIYFPSIGLTDRLRAALQVDWILIFKHLFVTFSWVSGWSFLHLPKAGYGVFIVLFALAGLGLLRRLITSKKRILKDDAFAAALSLVFFFVLGVAYHEVNVKATVKVMGGPGGWYFYALVLPIAYLLAVGIISACSRSNSGRLTKWCFILLSFGLLVTEIFGFFNALLPYYSGFAQPAADGWGVNMITRTPSGEAVARLVMDKPTIISAGVLAAAFILCLVLYLGMMALWMVTVRRADDLNEPIAEEEVTLSGQ